MTLTPIKCPEPGVYRDIPSDEYHSWDAVSQSRLKDVRKSPATAKYHMENPKVTRPLIVGDACHLSVMQPTLLDASYTFALPCSMAKRNGDGCKNPGNTMIGGKWYCGVHRGAGGGEVDPRPVISPEESLTLTLVTNAVKRDEEANRLLRESPPGKLAATELSLVWQDKETGLACKTRIDRVVECPKRGVLIVDFKTCEDASPDAFEGQMARYGYDIQAAFNLHGAAEHGIIADAFALLPVEKEEPNLLSVYPVSDESVVSGASEVRRLMRIYAECKRTGVWPGYPRKTISLPSWEMKRRDEQE